MLAHSMFAAEMRWLGLLGARKLACMKNSSAFL